MALSVPKSGSLMSVEHIRMRFPRALKFARAICNVTVIHHQLYMRFEKPSEFASHRVQDVGTSRIKLLNSPARLLDI